ncbi:MAG: hypothetical protein ACK4UN_06645 [Limisphaerales bacterium]
MENKPAIFNWTSPDGDCAMGIVTGIKVKKVKEEVVKITGNIETGECTLFFKSLDGVVKFRNFQVYDKLTRKQYEEFFDYLGNRVKAAQNKARQKRQLRLNPFLKSPPVPAVLQQRALQEIFPKNKPSHTEWLACVAAEAGKEAVEDSLKQAIETGNYILLERYLADFKALKQKPPGTTKKALVLFLYTYWAVINQPGMNATKVHQMADEKIGQDAAGDLASFQKFLSRAGIRFTKPGHPIKTK